MRLLIYMEQTVPRDVGVDLGRCQIAVSEQFLDAAQVGTAVEQVSGETMAESVRARGTGIQSCTRQMILQKTSYAAC